jgi:gamma-glutamylcyclotransferase (GGCT)/AIG2-like uncharacterized protein YtfP
MPDRRAPPHTVRGRGFRLNAHRLLFVYGTLRRGTPGAARRLLEGSAVYLDAGTYQGKLHDLGAYPGLTSSTDPADQVIGDVYALRAPRRTLRRLDTYEGGDYCRRVGVVATRRHGRLQAWIYLFQGSLAHRSRISGGDYLAHLRCNPAARRAARWSPMI